MEVFLANEQDVPVDETRLSSLARLALSDEDVDEAAELSVLLVTRGHIKQLNARFAGDDHETDVLAFPMGEDEGDELLLGDVVICPRVAKDNAERLKHRLDDELDILLVHGMLHLLGYDHQDEDEKAEMERRVAEIVRRFRVAGG